VYQSNDLANITRTYHSSAAKQLSSTQQAAQALAEQGARPDAPTGTTPRRRVWQYVDQWELTKSRDDLLGSWKHKGISAASSDTFLAEHLPLPAEDEHDEAMTVAEEPKSPTVESGEVSPVVSPLGLVGSLSSSASSSNSVPAPLGVFPPRVPTGKSWKSKVGQSQIEPLTDARNIYTTRGLRRAR